MALMEDMGCWAEAWGSSEHEIGIVIFIDSKKTQGRQSAKLFHVPIL